MLNCPKCSQVMKAGEQGVAMCGDCGGVWVPASRYRDELDSVGGVAALNMLLSSESKPTAFSCPACHGESLLGSRHRGVEVEWCRECQGIYFDRGELAEVRQAKPSTLSTVASGAGDVAAYLGGDVIVEGLLVVCEKISDGVGDVF